MSEADHPILLFIGAVLVAEQNQRTLSLVSWVGGDVNERRTNGRMDERKFIYWPAEKCSIHRAY